MIENNNLSKLNKYLYNFMMGTYLKSITLDQTSICNLKDRQKNYYTYKTPKTRLHEIAIPLKHVKKALKFYIGILDKYESYRNNFFLALNYYNKDNVCITFDFVITDYTIDKYNEITQDYYNFMINKCDGRIHYSKCGNKIN
jgi:hypothetical protein